MITDTVCAHRNDTENEYDDGDCDSTVHQRIDSEGRERCDSWNDE